VIAIADRPGWEFPLFVHVLGAMLLVGFLLAVLFALLAAARRTDMPAQLTLTRFAFRTLLIGVLPSWVIMFVGAIWTEEEAPFDEEAAWIAIGHIVAEPIGLLWFILATLFAGLAVRRLKRDSGSSGFVRASTVFTTILVIAYLVAIFAMTTKPD
jgi:hypothetical protein